MKKQTRNLFIFLGVILLIIGGFFYFRFTQSVLSGDQYYDERCIDVTQYYAQGYVNLRLDSYGCQIVGKSYVMNWLKYTWDCDQVANNCNSIYPGSSLVFRGPDSSGCQWYCAVYGYDEKGGMERVLNYCTYDAGDMLVAESFSGAKTITKDNLRYPIKAFCRAHPSIITDDATKTSITSTNIPQDLIDGKIVNILSGQTLTVFYTINNRYNLPSICDSNSNLALDLITNKTCKSTLGFTYLCSEGVFDALTGSCVVEPGVSAVCTKGRYDVQLDKCVYNPPLQVNCPDGYTFDLDIDACYRIPNSVNTCQAPYVLYEPTQSECKGVWQICPQCPIDKICSQSICKAQCSVGIECRYTPNLNTICINGTLINGKCTIEGQTINICPTGSTWNDNLKVCVIQPDTISVCPDGSMPNQGICYKLPDGYKECPTNQVLSGGQCVNMVDLFNANKPNNTYLYMIIGGLAIILIFTIFIKVRRRK